MGKMQHKYGKAAKLDLFCNKIRSPPLTWLLNTC